jgi:hypothetical protein
MVSRFLVAVDSNTLPALLARLSLSELFEIFDGLNAVGASTTANLFLEALHRLAASRWSRTTHPRCGRYRDGGAGSANGVPGPPRSGRIVRAEVCL